jgi:outer membrane protein
MRISLQRLFILFLMVCLLLPSPARAQETVKVGDILGLEQCIQIALNRHPSLLAATNTIRVFESRIGQARSNYLPQVNWQSTYTRNSPYTTNPRLGGTGQYDQYGSNVGLSQNIYDFQRTPTQVRIAKLNADSTRQDLENTRNQVVLGVKQGYYALVQALKNREVAKETVAQFDHHLLQARAFFEVGTKPKFDVTKAEVDLSNAKLNLIRAENAVRIARVNLNNAMGLPNAPEYNLESNLLFQKYEMKLGEALKKAYDGRPDLQSQLLKQESVNQSIELAKAANYPYITGNANYGFGGNEFPLDRGWNVGGTLNVPIFSGFLVQNQIAEARANLDVIKANVESLKQQIRLDVEQAFSNLQEALDRIGTTELAVRQAQENVDLANGRYASGVGNPIEVTDALVAHSNAKTSYISALTDYKTAQASLEKAMGIK